MTDQISRSVKKSSHTGIAEVQGVPSRGSPGPPFATRQNTKLSVSCAIVPLSWKFAGSGLKPGAKCPWPSRWAPYHEKTKWQEMEYHSARSAMRVRVGRREILQDNVRVIGLTRH